MRLFAFEARSFTKKGGEVVLIKINELECKGCGVCLDACPQNAIYLVDSVAGVDLERCDGCKICISECPNNAISWIDEKSEIVIPQDVELQRAHKSSFENYLAPRKRTSILPTVITAMATIGMEIVPKILDIMAARSTKPAQTKHSSVSYPKINQIPRTKSTHGQFRYRHRGRNF